jgi:hypothetical protein
MSLIEQFEEDMSEHLKNRVAAKNEFYSPRWREMIPVAKALASQMNDQEIHMFVGLLLARHLTDVEIAVETLAEAVTDAGYRIN